MTKKDIVNFIINNDVIKKYIHKQCLKQHRIDLEKDLFDFCLLQFLEKDLEFLWSKVNNNLTIDKYFETYFIGIVKNQINSDTSEFYKVYRNGGFFKKVSFEIITDDKTDTEVDLEYINKYNDEIEAKLNPINKAFRICDPLKIELFKMKYVDDKSYKEISDFYNIKISSVKNKIYLVKKNIKQILHNDINYNFEIPFPKRRGCNKEKE